MPVRVKNAGEIQRGEIYEACNFHPCLCTEIEGTQISGNSLVDGSYPRRCNILHCSIRKLTLEEALEWKLNGPNDIELKGKDRWW